MTDKMLAEIICRALLAIVAALRKRYGLPDTRNVTIQLTEYDSVIGMTTYR